MRFLTKPLVLGALFCLYLILYIGITHVLTIKKINTIKALNDQHLSRDSIKNTLRKGIAELRDTHDITILCKQLNLIRPENSTVFEIHCKGIPNFNGAIFFDTLSNHVDLVYINEFK